MVLAARRPWRWPLGWLFMLGLALGLGLWGWCAWLFFWVSSDHTGRYQWLAMGLWPWLPEALWLAVGALGLLGLVMTVNNLIRQNWKRALQWLLLAGLAAGHCAASVLPLAMATGGGTTLEVPKED
jgi:hypothetical protein